MRHLVAVVLSLFTVAAVPAVASAADPWSLPAPIRSNTTSAPLPGTPAVAANGSGQAIAVSNTGGALPDIGPHAVGSAFSDGSFSDPKQLTGANVAMGPGSGGVLPYGQTRLLGAGIRARTSSAQAVVAFGRLAPGGATLDDPRGIGPADMHASRPALAVNADGDAAVVYPVCRAADCRRVLVYLAVRRAGQSSFRSVRLADGDGPLPQVAAAVNDRGDVLAVWTQGSTVYARIRTAGGALRSRQRVGATIRGQHLAPSATLSRHRAELIGWLAQSVSEGDPSSGVAWVAQARDGGAFTATRLGGVPAAAGAGHYVSEAGVRVAYGAQGRALVAWTAFDGDPATGRFATRLAQLRGAANSSSQGLHNVQTVSTRRSTPSSPTSSPTPRAPRTCSCSPAFAATIRRPPHRASRCARAARRRSPRRQRAPRRPSVWMRHCCRTVAYSRCGGRAAEPRSPCGPPRLEGVLDEETIAPPEPSRDSRDDITRAGLLAGVRAGLPFAVAGGLLAVSFGVVAEDAGLSNVAAIVMSAVVFAGSAQFAAIAIVGQGGAIGAAVVAAALMNSRFLAMSIALAPSVRGRALWRALQGQTIVDASWALAARGDGTFDRAKLFGATAPAVPRVGRRNRGRSARRRLPRAPGALRARRDLPGVLPRLAAGGAAQPARHGRRGGRRADRPGARALRAGRRADPGGQRRGARGAHAPCARRRRHNAGGADDEQHRPARRRLRARSPQRSRRRARSCWAGETCRWRSAA